jgi:cobalt-zinc-cadmium efflux system membrane fusion protein
MSSKATPIVFGGTALLAVLCLTGYWFFVRHSSIAVNDAQQSEKTFVSADAQVAKPASDETGETSQAATVELSQDQWGTAGLTLLPVSKQRLQRVVPLTGKISLNEDRVAHIYPLVEGTVETVAVGLGAAVKENDPLVIVHSREIGEAKLTLYQARLQLEMAQVKDRIQSDIAANARELIRSLRALAPVVEIESQFRNRPMGDYRERLLSAYANYLKADADVMRLEGIADSGAISGKQLLSATATRNADLATFQARIEQIQYEIETSVLLSSQAVKEAETRVAVSATTLEILGCTDDEIRDVNPALQGEAISHYLIRAPFNGLVLTKDVVLGEHVRPDAMVFSIADLETVWLSADIYEEHIPLLSGLADQTIQVRSPLWPEKKFEAKVFYTGELVDEATRTISLRAVVQNSEKQLKPGMFVNVEIPLVSAQANLQVPRNAIQDLDGQQFVFIHQGNGRFMRRDVQTGASNSQSVEILSGVEEGEEVVATGGFVLKSRMLAALLGEE